MKTSDAGLKFIMNWEGTILKPYKDIAGILTIGCGHVIRANENFGAITVQDALELLRKDISIAEDGVTKLVKVQLTQQMFDSLVSFVFNLGSGALASSTLLKLLNAGDFAGAANEFTKWCKATDPKTGKLIVNQGLLNRRKSESALFMSTSALITEEVKELTPEDKASLVASIVSTTQNMVDEVIEETHRAIPDDVA